MSGSRPATFFAIVLTFFFALPSVCVGSPIGKIQSNNNTPGGCHRHRPGPSPTHTCCFAAYQVGAITPVAPSPVPPDSIIDRVLGAPLAGKPESALWLALGSLDPSPPLTAVLRI